MLILRITCRAGQAELTLTGTDVSYSAEARLDAELMTSRDQEDLRWYLEDYLDNPVDPAPEIAREIEDHLTIWGERLFTSLFHSSNGAKKLWQAAADRLPQVRVEIEAGPDSGVTVPWELLRDPATNQVLALAAESFIHTQPGAEAVLEPAAAGPLRVLLIICRPSAEKDVPFRSVAGLLVRLRRETRNAITLDVLRPPTFTRLTSVLAQAREQGKPYDVVHFDGHGIFEHADPGQLHPAVSPRQGRHGYLQFSHANDGRYPNYDRYQLVDGLTLGSVLADAGVPMLVMNACRSAFADPPAAPMTAEADAGTDLRVRTYGSLAQEVMAAGVPGVVAMRYKVYVASAAQFVTQVYAGLLDGQALGTAVAQARRSMADNPQRRLDLATHQLQDWVVPAVYEAAPFILRAAPLAAQESRASAGADTEGHDQGGPADALHGRDGTFLELDNAYDTCQIVLLHAWRGQGRTSTAVEFARWYQLTDAVDEVLYTPFDRNPPLARLLDQAWEHFAARSAGLDPGERRAAVSRELSRTRALWIWDDVDTTAEPTDDLAAFLHDLAETGCKVLLTSCRDRETWIDDPYKAVALPPLRMLDRVELAMFVAAEREAPFDVSAWQPLLRFTQGHPLTITAVARRAVQERRTTLADIEALVAEIRAGVTPIMGDADDSYAAALVTSLGDALARGFTDAERARLALLVLFQDFVDVRALCVMGDPRMPGEGVPEVAGMTETEGAALLDKAAGMGLLDAYRGDGGMGTGFYSPHPALPWHLRRLFAEHYGPADSRRAIAAVQSWTAAIGVLGHDHLRRSNEPAERHRINEMAFLEAEEANFLHARRLALCNDWHGLVIGPMQGLRPLYEQKARLGEWRRLVDELIPVLADPATDGPIPGRADQWAVLTAYRIALAVQDQDWQLARTLAAAHVSWHRQRVAAAPVPAGGELDERQRSRIMGLATALEQLAGMFRQQNDAACVPLYQEEFDVCLQAGIHHVAGVAAFNLGQVYGFVPGLIDFDQAERWCRRAEKLITPTDAVGRAKVKSQLGAVALQRFNTGTGQAGQRAHLDSAYQAYQEALRVVPAHATGELAIVHYQLGVVHAYRGKTDDAIEQWRKAISYHERRGSRLEAGQVRHNAAMALMNRADPRRALLYAQAAMRDFEAAGPRAAAFADRTRRLIEDLERQPPPQGEKQQENLPDEP